MWSGISKLSKRLVHHLSPIQTKAPNPHSQTPQSLPYLSLLERCRDMKELREIHARTIMVGLIRCTYITSRILAFSAVSEKGDLDYACRVFDRIPTPTIFNWNVMIKGCSRSAQPQLGLSIFVRMPADGVLPNINTFPFLIKACSGLNSLSQIHGQVVKFGFDLDIYVVSSLIKMYSNQNVDMAHKVFDESSNRNVVCWTRLISGYCSHDLVVEDRNVFDEMPERSDVSWSAMISGYVQNECHSEAIELFRKLKECAHLRPNRSVLVSILNACAGLGASEEGRWVHSHIDKNGFEYGVELGVKDNQSTIFSTK